MIFYATIGAIKMIIDVVLPRNVKSKIIKRRTKNYYNLKTPPKSLADRQKRFNVSFQKKAIRISIFQSDELVKIEINNYLQYILNDCDYIGVKNGLNIIELGSIKVYNL